MTCGIYSIQNNLTKERYIGKSVNIERRWDEHKKSINSCYKNVSDYPLYQSIRKYGLNNFDFTILEECNLENLDDKEIYWINFYDSYKNGYNQTPGGDASNYYSKLTLEQVNEIRELLLTSSLSMKEIGDKYGVCKNTITLINNNKIWYNKNIEQPIRKKESKFKCKECGKQLTKLSKSKTGLCLECYKKSLQKNIPSREELKNKIRTQSIQKIAEDYGYKSHSTVRKWCIKYGLPSIKKEINKYSDEEWNLI